MQRALNILLIEDDTIEVMKMKRVISSIEVHHQLIEAKNGEEALVLLSNKENLPDIILLDLNMPRKNGWEFLEEFIKIPFSQREHCTIHISSSFISQKKIEKAKSYDVVKNYLVKPFTEKSLQQIISAKRNYLFQNPQYHCLFPIQKKCTLHFL